MISGKEIACSHGTTLHVESIELILSSTGLLESWSFKHNSDAAVGARRLEFVSLSAWCFYL